MNFKKVKSSMLSEIAYDADGNRLHIRFSGGKEYVYHDVAQSLHDDMMAAESIGEFFAQNVRGKFQHRIVEQDK